MKHDVRVVESSDQGCTLEVPGRFTLSIKYPPTPRRRRRRTASTPAPLAMNPALDWENKSSDEIKDFAAKYHTEAIQGGKHPLRSWVATKINASKNGVPASVISDIDDWMRLFAFRAKLPSYNAHRQRSAT